jgi:diacylglycerol O-acyltransferase
MSEHPTALDATFLELEEFDDSAHMHIGGALVFDAVPGEGAPALEDLLVQLDERLDRLPRYRQRLSRPRTGRFAWPAWEDDPRFDISAHVRHAALPAPGAEDELLDWIADFYSHRLDRSRPLWEMVLLDGLAGGRWALVWKTHHCMVDGVGSVDVAQVLLDTEPDPVAPATAAGSGEAPGSRRGLLRSLLPSPPEPFGQASGAAVDLVRGAAHAAWHPREAIRRSAALAALIVREEVLGAPKSSLNEPTGGTRRMALVHAELDELKAITTGLGGTVNDVVLAASTSGLRRMLEARGEALPARGLRAMVPVNVRSNGEHGDLGNRILSLFVDLPVAEPEPLRRYRRVVNETRRLKRGSQALGADTLLLATGLMPPVLHGVLARSLFATRLFNVTITNVPGPRQRLYAFGAPMVDIVPLVPLAADHAVGIAVVSYAGTLAFGLTADRKTVPDLGVLARGIVEAIDELRDLATDAGSPR